MGKKAKKYKGFWFKPEAYSILNLKMIEELDNLFDLVPPHMLRKSINEIFWAYLCNTEQENLMPEIKEIATDFNCLLRFLEVAEIYEREHELKKFQLKKG